MSKQRIILESWRKFLNESRQDVIASEDAAVKEFEGKLKIEPGYPTEKDNQHWTATYKGFAICNDKEISITRMKGNAGEHELGDFERGSIEGRGRYSLDNWKKEKDDVLEKGIEKPILIVAKWEGDNVIARVYEGNHRIRLGCQTKQPIPVEIRFFGKSEEHIDEVYFDFDLRRLIQYGLQ
tara:strand:+ start:329 stop:871 length:543 start_codon:yes stop_codon:yes gene_type:complete